MAFAKIEDGTGSLEVVLFHDIFSKNKPLLAPGTPLLVRGRLEKRGSSVTLVADQLGGMDQPDRLYESILLKLDEGIAMDALKRMKDVLKEYPGDRPVYVEMTDGGTTFEFRVGWNCRPTGPLRRKLETILGPHSVFFLKTRDHPIPA